MARKSDRPLGLSRADRTLWDHVARSIDPLDSDRFIGGAPDDPIKVGNPATPKSTIVVPKKAPVVPRERRALTAAEIREALLGGHGTEFSGMHEGAEATPSRRQNVPGLDRRSSERLRKGQMEIDGRLDLHGLTRAAAERQLRSFITTAQGQGKRCVLVITGKGSSTKKTDDAPFMVPQKPGILREAVPKWLQGPELRHLVIDIRAAQPKHGGSGALYVLLRRRRG